MNSLDCNTFTNLVSSIDEKEKSVEVEKDETRRTKLSMLILKKDLIAQDVKLDKIERSFNLLDTEIQNYTSQSYKCREENPGEMLTRNLMKKYMIAHRIGG
jgi:CII-binding regulator of phage lambda lysogenization HflD